VPKDTTVSLFGSKISFEKQLENWLKIVFKIEPVLLQGF
jgi:hypothetical protein